MIKKIAFVAHPARDVAAGRQFFGEILGLECTADHAHEDGKAWVEYRTPDGKTIALDPFSAEMSPNPTPYLALETDDIEAELERLREHGVSVVMDLQVNRNQEGQLICKMAIVLDPNGNALMLHEIAPDRASD